MNIRSIVYVSIFSLGILFFSNTEAGSALAGGCCYKKFVSTPGIVGSQPAKITVSFIDPANPYADAGKTTLSSLANERVLIKIVQPKAGQSCVMLSPTTNEQGKIQAECTSKNIDKIKVYFEAPDIDPQYQEMFSNVTQIITFNGLATSQPTVQPTTVLQPKQTPQPSSTPVMSPKVTVLPTTDPQLENRIQELEQKIETQEKEISGLRKLVDKLMNFFNNLF